MDLLLHNDTARVIGFRALVIYVGLQRLRHYAQTRDCCHY
jgi:hypothetical protein